MSVPASLSPVPGSPPDAGASRARAVATAPQTWSAARPLATGLAVVALLFGGFGTWAALANISGAIVSSGRVAVESNRQVVQHPDGGVVSAILVREGDAVEVGQVLIRLDPTLLRSGADILESQIAEIDARIARLVAERDTAAAIAFPPGVTEAAASDTAVAEMVRGQADLFEVHAMTLSQQVEQLGRRQEQIDDQIDGLSAQADAVTSQLGLIREEMVAQRSLLERGLAQAPRVLALEREEAGLLGQLGQFEAGAAELRGRAVEIDLEILKLRTQARETAITELRDVQYRHIELSEDLAATRERLTRLEITAPVSGVVYDMQVFADRSVIRPADPILYLVPQDRALVITTRVDPIHIDQAYPSQPVTLRLPTFDARTTPELYGTITRISPDAFVDQATGASYYEVEILPDAGEVRKLGTNVLLPGMPVEAYLRTDDRTPLAYLLHPLANYFNRAFRE